MNPSELRIGNIIEYREQDCYQDENGSIHCGWTDWRLKLTDADVLEEISDCLNNSFDFRPIEINHDWLERFGFNRINGSGVYNLSGTLGNLYKAKVGYYYQYIYLRIRIDYVHELQNLFYSLSGKDLTLMV